MMVKSSPVLGYLFPDSPFFCIVKHFMHGIEIFHVKRMKQT